MLTRRSAAATVAVIIASSILTASSCAGPSSSRVQGVSAGRCRDGDVAAWTERLRGAVQEWFRATLARDYGALVALMLPRYVEKLGGRDAVIAEARAGDDDMRAIGGIVPKAADVVEVPAPVCAESELLSIVRVNMTMETPTGGLLVQVLVVAVSADGGESWKMVDVPSKAPDQIKTLFPGWPGSLSIPATDPPRKL